MPLVYAIIGDLVASRALADRAGVHRALGQALDRVTADLAPRQRLEATVGDEFQGAFATLEEAVRATLVLRLELRPLVDVRFGIGSGPVEVFDAEARPMQQDGPAWWSAREALEHLARPGSRLQRTWYVPGSTDAPGGVDAWCNSFLRCRDQLVDRLNDTGRSILLLSLRGLSQTQIAREVGISESAVSQQFAKGVAAVRDAQALLEAGASR